MLLDAEVLLALVWPSSRHEGHRAAHVWFAETGRLGEQHADRAWRVAVVDHPAVSKGAVSPADAVGILDAMMAHPAHEFWPLEEMPLKVWGDVLGRIQARRQAERRDGGVATFDKGMKRLAGERLGDRVVVLG